jgi:hypothetical protein
MTSRNRAMVLKSWVLMVGVSIGCSSIASGQRPSAETAAASMVDVALPADWVGGFDNLAQLSADANKALLSELLDAVTAVAGKPSGMQEFMPAFQYPAYMRPLFKAGQVQTAIGRQYITRLKGLTPTDLAAWKDALKQASGATDTDIIVAYGMIQIESLWMADRITDETKQRAIARLSSIPASAFDEWSEPSGVKGDRAVFLMQTPDLFINNRFDTDLFQKALPIAKQKYKERSEEQDRGRKAKTATSK